MGSVNWIEGALGDAGAEKRLVDGADAIVHAALDHPGGGFRDTEGDRLGFIKTNLLGTLRLIEAAQAAGVGRFIFISSCAVHDRILPDRLLDETHPLWPESHYGAHKAAIEAFVHSYGYGEGVPICALRPTGIYGLAYPPRSSKWYSLIERIVEGKPVECHRGGKEVHASDVARAVEVMMAAVPTAITGEAFNCCDRYVSDHEVASIAQAHRQQLRDPRRANRSEEPDRDEEARGARDDLRGYAPSGTDDPADDRFRGRSIGTPGTVGERGSRPGIGSRHGPAGGGVGIRDRG